jgi:disulfide bond formation protein DsbB
MYQQKRITTPATPQVWSGLSGEHPATLPGGPPMASTLTSVEDKAVTPQALREPSPLLWAALALTVAAGGLVGSLLLSLGMNLKACPLCFYQRTFMMSLVALLGMGLLASVPRPGLLSLLALPLAVAGLGVASFHVWLEASGRLECPQGVLGLGTAPQQSLAVFAVLAGLLLFDALRWGVGARALPVVAVLLGAALTVASCTSNPPVQRPDPKVYDQPPDGCRPPLQS